MENVGSMIQEKEEEEEKEGGRVERKREKRVKGRLRPEATSKQSKKKFIRPREWPLSLPVSWDG